MCVSQLKKIANDIEIYVMERYLFMNQKIIGGDRLEFSSICRSKKNQLIYEEKHSSPIFDIHCRTHEENISMEY